MKRVYYDEKPLSIEAVGNGNYLYRTDIQQETINHGSDEGETTAWSCYEVTIAGNPTYEKCVQAMIGSEYSYDEEIGLINKYNTYQTGGSDDPSAVSEYEAYIQRISAIKDTVAADFSVIRPSSNLGADPRISDLFKLIQITINNIELTDAEALSIKRLYPKWENYIGKSLTKDQKIQYGESLYKVVQDISVVLENQYPSIDTAALYEEINEEHAGTQADPIPYNNNMELVQGKYYEQDDEIYYCHYGSGQPVYADLADLTIYVTLVTNE